VRVRLMRRPPSTPDSRHLDAMLREVGEYLGVNRAFVFRKLGVHARPALLLRCDLPSLGAVHDRAVKTLSPRQRNRKLDMLIATQR